MKKLFFFIIIILLYNEIIYSQIYVTLREPPPGFFKVENFWRVTINNTTQNSYSVYLVGKATEQNEGEIVRATTAVFKLIPGIKNVNASEIGPVDVSEPSTKFKKAVEKTGNLPAGNYQICINLIDASTGQMLGNDCIIQNVQNYSGIVTVYPSDNSVISTSQQVFQWIPPSPLFQSQLPDYTLTIVEILPGQTRYDAIESNPAFFEKKNIKSSIYVYPNISRNFEIGKKYAWKVIAFLNGVQISTSEIKGVEVGIGINAHNLYYSKSMLNNDIIDINKNSIKCLRNDSFESILKCEINKNITSNKLIGVGLKEKHINLFKESINSKNPFTISGSVRTSGQISNRTGSYSSSPATFWRFDLNPKFSFYNIPFNISFFLTSEQGELKQNINNLSVKLDAGSISAYINANKKSPGYLKFFSHFKNLGFGLNYPDFTDYTLKGVPVNGIYLAFNPGIFYIAFSGFNNKKAIDYVSYKRNLFSGKIGIGNPDKSHFHISLLYAKDDENSIKIDSSDFFLRPMANYVAGADGKILLLKERLSLEGEAGVSFLTRDVTSPEIEVKDAPKWLTNILHPRTSSSFDFFYRLKSSFTNPESNSKISTGFKLIGAGYHSLGAPNIRTDLIGYDFAFEQGILNKQVFLNVSFNREIDNLIDWKSSATTLTNINISLMLNFLNYPVIRVSYSPYFQKNDASTENMQINNISHLISFYTGYTKNIGEIISNSGLYYSFQKSLTISDINNSTIHYLSLNQNISFKFPLSISAGFSWINSNYCSLITNSFAVDLNTSYSFFEKWNNTVGCNVNFESNTNKKYGLYASSSLNIGEFLNVDLRLEQYFYLDKFQSSNNYNEIIFKGIISVLW